MVDSGTSSSNRLVIPRKLPANAMPVADAKDKKIVANYKLPRDEQAGQDGTPQVSYKSQKGAQKRKAQRQRRQNKRKDMLGNMSSDERQAYIAREKVENAQNDEKMRQRLEKGKLEGNRLI